MGDNWCACDACLKNAHPKSGGPWSLADARTAAFHARRCIYLHVLAVGLLCKATLLPLVVDHESVLDVQVVACR